MEEPQKFDDYAKSYEGLHKSSISASGEDPAYFHDYKIEELRRRGLLEGPLLDYGCGTGNLLERFARILPEVHGFDPSSESLREAAERAKTATLHDHPAKLPEAHFATAVLSGVLHHVPKVERRDVLERVRASLRPGGRVVVFEHNPLNPLTRRAVQMCPFDDDAVLLWPWEARRRLRAAGFRGVSLDYIVFFPKQLAFLRRFEPHLHMLAFGAQQLLIGERK